VAIGRGEGRRAPHGANQSTSTRSATTKARPASPRQGPGELQSNCARLIYSRDLPKIFEPGGTERTSQTFPPMMEPRPMTVSPPRIVAPE
jgi:hypothetical protein